MIDKANLLDMQYVVLGTLLRHPEQIGPALAKLKAEDFSGQLATAGLFAAIVQLFGDGAPVDPVSVRRQAGEEYAPAIDAALQAAMPNGAGLSWYCEALGEYSRLSALQSAGAELYGAANLDEAETVMDRANGLLSQQRSTDIATAPELCQDFYDRLSEDEGAQFLPWGLAELDGKLFARAGSFVVLGGYPSSGKTLLALQCALHQARSYRVGFFSLETDKRTLAERIFAHLAQVPLQCIKKRELTDEQSEALAKAAVAMSKLSFEFVGAAGMSPGDIQATALSRRYQIIYVDYLQLVQAAGQSRYDIVTSVSIGLHRLAQKNSIAVVALAQLSRVGKDKTPPSMSSLRESGQIEQDADAVLLIYPEDIDNNSSDRVIKAAKNKDGQWFDAKLSLDGARQTFASSQRAKQAETFQQIRRDAKRSRAEYQQVQLQELPAAEPLPF